MDAHKLGKKLGNTFSDIAAEPIPPRLARLLDDEPPPTGGASGASKPVEKRPIRAAHDLRHRKSVYEAVNS
jgi:hypothetical protein